MFQRNMLAHLQNKIYKSNKNTVKYPNHQRQLYWKHDLQLSLKGETVRDKIIKQIKYKAFDQTEQVP